MLPSVSWLHAVASLSVLLSSVYAAPAAQNGRRGVGDCLFDDSKTEVHVIDIEMAGWESNPVPLNVKFLGSGQFSCGYEVVAPFELPDGHMVHAAAKTAQGAVGFKYEVEALKGIGEFYGYGEDEGGRIWLFMQWHGGKTVVRTRAWMERFPSGYNQDTTEEGIKSCETFLRRIYDLIVREQMRYLETYGWLHEDGNFANFHFDDDLTHVEIFDWGVSRKADPSEANEEMYTRLMKVYEGFSMLPTHDTTFYQGICESKKRKKYNLTFFSPLE